MLRLIQSGWSLERTLASVRLGPSDVAHVLPVIAGLVLAVACPWAFGRTHIPLFVDGSNPSQQSFVRLVNPRQQPVELLVTVIDDEGSYFGPASFTLDGYAVRHFNSADLQEQISEEIGQSGQAGDWRLVIDSRDGSEFDARGYMRTQDGFVTSMHETAVETCEGSECSIYYLPTFNPASNRNQRSRLRLINLDESPVDVAIVGVDDRGLSPGTEVRLTLGPSSSRTLTAAELETGEATGLDGALADGEGKWRLKVTSQGGRVRAVSLLESPTGHLTNLSRGGLIGGDVLLFRSASHTTQQSFVRIINQGDDAVTVTVTAFDESGAKLGSAPVDVSAHGVTHFNSRDLEEWLALAANTGDLRLDIDRGGHISAVEVHAYIRTKDGFLTAMNDTSRRAGWPSGYHDYDGRSYYYVSFFNPGSNEAQLSQLLIVNSGYDDANVHIVAVDDNGVSRGSGVSMQIPWRGSRTVTSAELEFGSREFEGSLGDGVGKWRLYLFGDQKGESLEVMSLLESPTGHLTNLTSRQRDAPGLPPAIMDPRLRALVGTALGNDRDAEVSRRELADLTSLQIPADSGIENWAGLQIAVNLKRFEMAGEGQFDLSVLTGLIRLEHLDLGGNEVPTLKPLSGHAELRTLFLGRSADTDLGPLANLIELQTLAVSGSAITDIGPLVRLTRLETLYLGSNLISDLSALTELRSLTSLYLGHNQIRDISPLAELTRLRHLDLGSNGMSDISPLAGLPALRHLKLDNNEKIVEISALAGLTALQELDLWDNEISDISALAGLSALQELYLSGNDISDIWPLAGLTALRSLDLSSNDISDISPLAGLTALRSLELSSNDISDISALAGMHGLWWLRIEKNSVVDISALQSLTRLTHLSLYHNEIEDVSPLESLTNLGYLDLSFNRIVDLAPLVRNSGLGHGDRIELVGNGALSDESMFVVIAELESRGALVQRTVLRGIQFDGIEKDSVAVFRIEDNLEELVALTVNDYDYGRLVPAELTHAFYTYFEDAFDFIAIIANLERTGGLATYHGVRNDVGGVGRGRFYSSDYGSQRLQGVTFFRWNNGPLQRGPTLHEFMHRWGNHGFIPTTGHPPAPERSARKMWSHWGFSSVNGVLGGFDVGKLQMLGEGRYAVSVVGPWGYTGNGRPYSPLEMYLAGFGAPEEVPDVWVAADGWYEHVDASGNVGKTAEGGVIFTAGDVRTYKIDDLIGLHGPRDPAVGEAQREFRTAIVLLTDDSHPATVERLDALSEEASWFTRRGADDNDGLYNFFEATRGRGSMTMDALSSALKPVPAAPTGLPTSFGEIPPPLMMLPDGRCMTLEKRSTQGVRTERYIGGRLDEEHFLREWNR